MRFLQEAAVPFNEEKPHLLSNICRPFCAAGMKCREIVILPAQEVFVNRDSGKARP